MDQPTPAPTRKVTSGGLAGALSILVIWLINTVVGKEVPPEVASSFTVVLTFIVAYLVPERA